MRSAPLPQKPAFMQATADCCCCAMKEMAMRNIGKPATMRDGISGQTRNGTPSYLFETLMKEFENAAAH